MADNIEYKIYQLKSSSEYHGIRFESFETNKDKNLAISDYELVYSGKWSEINGNTTEDKLNAVYEKFNLDLPSDFKGHSLSVSDVITVGDTAHYVDDMGFEQMPDFFRAKEKTQDVSREPVQSVQDLPTVKITVSDKGIIGNTPYKDIPNKRYIKMSAEEAIKAAEKLEAAGVIGYSGRIIGDKATITIGSDDEPLFRALTISPEEIKSQTKQELIEKINELQELKKSLEDAEFDLKYATKKYISYVSDGSLEEKQSALEEMKQVVRDMDMIQTRYDELYADYTDVANRFNYFLQADFKEALTKDMPKILHSFLSSDEIDRLAYDFANSEEFDEQALIGRTLEIFNGNQGYIIDERDVTEPNELSPLEAFAKNFFGADKPVPELTCETSENGSGVVFTLANLNVAFTTNELSQIVLLQVQDRDKEIQKEKPKAHKPSLAERIGDVKKKSVQRSAEVKPNNKTKGVDLS